MKYRVEYWSKEDNNWIILSRHANLPYAEANAETINQSRKCNVRIIHNGEIVAFYEVKND